MNRKSISILGLVICLAVLLIIGASLLLPGRDSQPVIAIDDLPAFSGNPFVVINNNMPQFSEEDITDKSFEFYSDMDAYNRCGYAMACVGVDIMPTEERGSIGQIKPTGWQTVKYDIVDGKYLYNRCHLIGYQLTGENSNPYNLITGTRYLNMEGMLPFENQVAEYVKETENHVMYRVTPVFHQEEMVARGVQIEAWSVEDNGKGVCFNIYAYNNQPGIIIDYKTGDSMLDHGSVPEVTTQPTIQAIYIINISTKKFHLATCGQGKATKEENKEYYDGNRENLINEGYAPAGCCDP